MHTGGSANLTGTVKKWLPVLMETGVGNNGFSSLLQLHFGHYIVGLEHPSIAELNATLAEIPLISGYAPTWWKHHINILLEKSQAIMRLNDYALSCCSKQTVIQTTNGLARLQSQVEWLEFIADEQYGSRKYKDAITQCLNKHL